MSSATIPVKKNMIGVSKNGTLDYTKLETMLGDLILQKEDHVNAPAFIIRPDTVEETLTLLRDEAGFDHLSCVTAQEYEDRFESIYHLRKYDSPQHELGIVVPSPKNNPWNQSASSVFRTADWHEREAYDLVGIHYEGHPDLRRILLPDTWQGHPLSLDYDQNKPQIITLQEHENPLQHNVEDNTMFINIGPHHPATHGVLHLKTVLDGEHVVAVDPDIGYLHRCEEQMAQGLNYRYQIMPYPDRWDYASAGLLNEWAYARAAEDLVNIEVPEYAEILRTMGAELCRICAHFLAVGTFALDVYGDFTAIFMYAMRDREIVQSILEDLTGQRMMFNYFRLGGVVWDLPEPRSEFLSKIRIFLDAIPSGIQEYSDLMTSNEIFQLRCVDIGVLSPDVARQYGVTGPVARGSGIDYDLRRDDPYGYYKNLDWDVVTNDGCDIYSRFLVRLGEVEQSAKIVDQCVSLLESWPEEDRIIQANVPRTIKPPADAEIYRAVEAAKGELGIYIRSDGTQQPARFKIRSPCFSNLSTLSEMAKGGLVPDLIAALGSLDIVLGEVDR